MKVLNDHYRLLLGLDSSWQVANVNLSLEEKRVVIELKHVGKEVVCPDCKPQCKIADHAPERQWRHLDTIQFETQIRAKALRSSCEQCGVKTTSVPWAGKHSRFTLMFEAFAIDLLLACSSVSKAATVLRLDWHSVHAIMERGVERGMLRRSTEQVKRVGIDEKSFRRGHDYISLTTEIDASRVLDVVEGRDEESANEL